MTAAGAWLTPTCVLLQTLPYTAADPSLHLHCGRPAPRMHTPPS